MKYLLLCFAFFLFSDVSGQNKLYVSKSTGQFSQDSGTYTKTTDRYERGNFTYSIQGPIKAVVEPATLSINSNETKTWKGKVYPDIRTAPPEGSSANAAISYSGTKRFSRPATGSTTSGQTIESTHPCYGCATHPDGGQHEIVNETSSGQIPFVVYTLGLTFTGPDCAYKGSNLKLTATGYPAGGTYEWKSLTPDKLKVTGNGAEGAITCTAGNGIGTGKIEISYKINNVTHKKTKDITFFMLIPVLSKSSICDGDGVKVTLKPMPDIPRGRVMESIANLEIRSKPLVGRNEIPVNIIKTTEIKFSPPDGNLESTAPVVYWFIPDKRRTTCMVNSQYEIWAEGQNKADEGRITTQNVKLTASARIRGDDPCIKGDATIQIDLPDLTRPVYTPNRPVNGIITFNQPAGTYPGFSITLTQGRGNVGTMQAKFTKGNFKLSHSPFNNRTNPASQFYPLVEFEEKFHVAQFGGQTQIPELANVLSAERVIARVNASLRSKRFGPGRYDQALREYTLYCWTEFIKAVGIEVNLFNDLTSGWARNIRCRLEREAKEALKKAFGEIFIADMPCAYTECR